MYFNTFLVMADSGVRLSVEVSVVGAQAVLVNWTLDTDQRSGQKGDKGETKGHQVQLEIVYSPVQAR